MQIVVNIEKRMAYFLGALLFVFIAVLGVNAANNSYVGHSPNDIDWSEEITQTMKVRNIEVVEGLKLEREGVSSCGSGTEGFVRYSAGRKLEICNGSAWDSSEGAEFTTDDIVTGAHTKDECTSAGGEVYEFETGRFLCKFDSEECPGQWSQYFDWSTTENEKCSSSRDSCNTGEHVFANKVLDTCEYSYYESYRYVDSEGISRTGYRWVTRTCSATITEVGCY